MRFWLLFSFGNAVLALIPLLLSRLGHGAKSSGKRPLIWVPLYVVAVLGLSITRLAGVELIGLVGDSFDGAGLLSFFGITLVLPMVLITAVLWTLSHWLANR